jgi:hypothetical protein
MLFIIFDVWLLAREPMHLGVLRVLTEQTLEINSVVKDSTQPDPSLVTEVKDSSLTSLHRFYSVPGAFVETGRIVGGFLQS